MARAYWKSGGAIASGAIQWDMRENRRVFDVATLGVT